MKATPEGRSSCSDGKKAGPRLRRELLLGPGSVPGALAPTPGGADNCGRAMSSLTPSTVIHNSKISTAEKMVELWVGAYVHHLVLALLPATKQDWLPDVAV